MAKPDAGKMLSGQITQLMTVSGMDAETLGTRLGVTGRTIYNRMHKPEDWKFGELQKLARVFAANGLALELHIGG